MFDLVRDLEGLSIVHYIVDAELPAYGIALKKAVEAYADGNPGCARLLSIAVRQARCITIQDIEQIVGWSLLDRRRETGEQLYVRFRGGSSI